MSCFRPLDAYRGVGGAIVFDKVKSLSKTAFQLPCGQCIGCRMDKAYAWGIRCLHEKKMHRDNCFVTLTYNDEFVPEGSTLVKRDLQLFMKRLRKVKGAGVRFFAGGEYGELNKRPHYHLLLFNCGFPDMAFHARNARGECLYTSSELAGLWFQGFNTIGEITMDSAVYCAKYALKKVNGDAAFSHYEFVDVDGMVYDRQPEFAVMSRRPGIGMPYYQKYGKEVRDLDTVVVDGKEIKPPRYYDVKTKATDEDVAERWRRVRKRDAVANKADNTPARLSVKEEIARRAMEKKERKL